MNENTVCIGSAIEILESTNQSLIGKRGVVVDETRNTLVIRDHEVTKRVPKHCTIFKLNNQNIINGDDLLKRPEERTIPK